MKRGVGRTAQFDHHNIVFPSPRVVGMWHLLGLDGRNVLGFVFDTVAHNVPHIHVLVKSRHRQRWMIETVCGSQDNVWMNQGTTAPLTLHEKWELSRNGIFATDPASGASTIVSVSVVAILPSLVVTRHGRERIKTLAKRMDVWVCMAAE